LWSFLVPAIFCKFIFVGGQRWPIPLRWQAESAICREIKKGSRKLRETWGRMHFQGFSLDPVLPYNTPDFRCEHQFPQILISRIRTKQETRHLPERRLRQGNRADDESGCLPQPAPETIEADDGGWV
jgi:hypothetical protein